MKSKFNLKIVFTVEGMPLIFECFSTNLCTNLYSLKAYDRYDLKELQNFKHDTWSDLFFQISKDFISEYYVY